MQPPPAVPPQWSPDGMWWWDGSKWRPWTDVMPPAAAPPPSPGFAIPPSPKYGMPMPAPAYGVPQPIPSYMDIALTPSPGLRTFLLVVLSIATVITGFFFLFGLLGVAGGGGASDSGVYVLFAIFVVLFAASLLALIGVATRTRWARVAAIVAGVAVSLTCLGLVLGIPILIAAARAPNLGMRPA